MNVTTLVTAAGVTAALALGFMAGCGPGGRPGKMAAPGTAEVS